jgi:hypothetical protein
MTELYAEQLAGYNERRNQLKQAEQALIKKAALMEQAERVRTEIKELDFELNAVKENLWALVDRRAAAVRVTLAGLMDKVNNFLPAGEADLKISDGNEFLIAWRVNGISRPYNGLSGGEKQIFNAALLAALGAGVLIIEGGEIDFENRRAIIKKLDDEIERQIIMSIWGIQLLPEGVSGWTTINAGGAA